LIFLKYIYILTGGRHKIGASIVALWRPIEKHWRQAQNTRRYKYTAAGRSWNCQKSVFEVYRKNCSSSCLYYWYTLMDNCLKLSITYFFIFDIPNIGVKGQGASAVGLTAAVRIDPITREWVLEVFTKKKKKKKIN
jgi:hypothetical protein